MGGTVFWLLLWLVIVTVFALSNLTPAVTVRFWQWTIISDGPLGVVVIGAGVLGALLTYVGSLMHHVRQAQQIRSLQQSARARDTVQPAPLAAGSGPVSAPAASSPESRRPS